MVAYNQIGGLGFYLLRFKEWNKGQSLWQQNKINKKRER